MWLVELSKHGLRLLAERFVHVFDAVKRREMLKKYRQPDPFERHGYTSDIDAAMSLLPDARYRTCLDVGTGLGLFAERAAAFCNQVIAIDFSRVAIRRARTRLHGIPNLSFRARNIRRFTGAQGPFDLIILGDVLYYVGDYEFPTQFEGVIDRIVCLLSPGGRILMSHHVSPDRPEPDISAYTTAFERRGLTVERRQRFTDGPIQVVQAVLRAPQPTRSSDIPR